MVERTKKDHDPEEDDRVRRKISEDMEKLPPAETLNVSVESFIKANPEATARDYGEYVEK